MNARELGVSPDLIGPGEFPYPSMRTEKPNVTEAHPIGFSPDGETILFCTHFDGGKQPIEVARTFIEDLVQSDGEAMVEAIEQRVVAYANRIAGAVWN